MPDGTPIPFGLCHCGCGAATNLASKTMNARGEVKGQPRRYLLGHQPRPVVLNACCSIPGCGGRIEAWGWCNVHYRRWRRHGDPQWVRKWPTVEERFWSKVSKDGPIPEHCPELGPCWIWTAGKMGWGYGSFTPVKGGATPAHRFAWVLAHPGVALTSLVLHHCDNPLCVRADHLFLGSAADNTADMITKRRGWWQSAATKPD